MEDNTAELSELKATMKAKLESNKSHYQVSMDKMKLELMDAQLTADELRHDLKEWKERYDMLREGVE